LSQPLLNERRNLIESHRQLFRAFPTGLRHVGTTAPVAIDQCRRRVGPLPGMYALDGV
jgi:hypothetical protein